MRVNGLNNNAMHHKLGTEGKLRFKVYFVSILLYTLLKHVLLVLYVLLCHIFCVTCMQKEVVDHFPTLKEIARARGIGTSAYLDELATGGTQLQKSNIHQVYDHLCKVWNHLVVTLEYYLVVCCRCEIPYLCISSKLCLIWWADYSYNKSIDAMNHMVR